MKRYEENVEHDNMHLPDWMLFLRAWRVAFSRYKLWGSTTLVLLLLSVPSYLQTSSAFRGMIGNRYPNAAEARDLHGSMGAPSLNLGEVFRQDHRGALAQLDESLAASGAALAFFAFLFGVFAAGGWLQVIFEQPHRQTLRRFGFGGARYFGRFLRVGVLTVLALGLVRWIWYGAPWSYIVEGLILDVPEYDRGKLETLGSERQVRSLGWLQDGMFAIAFAKVMVWATYTRTRMALRDGRSAFVAAASTAFLLMRHPVQTFRPLLLLLVLEAFVVLGVCGLGMGAAEASFDADPGGGRVAVMFSIGALALAWRQITRGARYHAAGRVSQALVLPTEQRPDPWAQTIGGPGGPQYPVADDGYRVTI